MNLEHQLEQLKLKTARIGQQIDQLKANAEQRVRDLEDVQRLLVELNSLINTK